MHAKKYLLNFYKLTSNIIKWPQPSSHATLVLHMLNCRFFLAKCVTESQVLRAGV